MSVHNNCVCQGIFEKIIGLESRLKSENRPFDSSFARGVFLFFHRCLAAIQS